MQREKQLLELFQVEELEKRYEMGWIARERANNDEGVGVGIEF